MHKYDAVMPDLNFDIRIASSKYFLAQTTYQLHDNVLGAKMVTSIDDYLADMMGYYGYQIQNGNGNMISPRDVNFGMQLINGMIQLTKDAHQDALTNKMQAQFNDYKAKFGAYLSAAQQ
jgi:hypothetical protein